MPPPLHEYLSLPLAAYGVWGAFILLTELQLPLPVYEMVQPLVAGIYFS
jgi:hypothetical protein